MVSHASLGVSGLETSPHFSLPSAGLVATPRNLCHRLHLAFCWGVPFPSLELLSLPPFGSVRSLCHSPLSPCECFRALAANTLELPHQDSKLSAPGGSPPLASPKRSLTFQLVLLKFHPVLLTCWGWATSLWAGEGEWLCWRLFCCGLFCTRSASSNYFFFLITRDHSHLRTYTARNTIHPRKEKWTDEQKALSWALLR